MPTGWYRGEPWGAAAMSMRGLVEVVPGFWVSADQVTAVIAREGLSSRVGPDLLPSVRVVISGHDSTGWEFKTWAEALAFAAKISAAINAKRTT
jgi:hypothetical protein